MFESLTMLTFDAIVKIGVIVYPGVEPIDIGGTVGVISMARRVLPNLSYSIVAETAGPVMMAGGLILQADHGFDTAPAFDRLIVCGGPGWKEQTTNPAMLVFLARQSSGSVAAVCTGALILAAAGLLDGRKATTRRNAVPGETRAPLAELARLSPTSSPVSAAIVTDHGVTTSGGVSLAIDGTLFILGQLFGTSVRADIAKLIEYDRAFAANRSELGHVIIAEGA